MFRKALNYAHQIKHVVADFGSQSFCHEILEEAFYHMLDFVVEMSFFVVKSFLPQRVCNSQCADGSFAGSSWTIDLPEGHLDLLVINIQFFMHFVTCFFLFFA